MGSSIAEDHHIISSVLQYAFPEDWMENQGKLIQERATDVQSMALQTARRSLAMALLAQEGAITPNDATPTCQRALEALTLAHTVSPGATSPKAGATAASLAQADFRAIAKAVEVAGYRTSTELPSVAIDTGEHLGHAAISGGRRARSGVGGAR